MDTKVEQLNNEGVQHFLKGEFTEAKEKYFEALELSPEYTTTLNNLGMLFLQEENFEQAEVYFKKALSIQEKATYFNNLGHAYASQNEFELAETQYRNAIGKDGQSLMAFKSLASLYQHTGRYQASTKIWEHIVLELSHDADYKLNLAKDYLELKEFDIAMDVLLEIIQQKKHREYAYYYISLIHFHNKNYGLALDAVNRALGIQPENSQFRKLAGTIHLSLSNLREALSEWNFILKLNPQNHDVRTDVAVALLSFKHWNEALIELNIVLEKSDFPKAKYYKALALLEMGEDKEVAMKILKEISMNKSNYSHQAEEYMTYLSSQK